MTIIIIIIIIFYYYLLLLLLLLNYTLSMLISLLSKSGSLDKFFFNMHFIATVFSVSYDNKRTHRFTHNRHK